MLKYYIHQTLTNQSKSLFILDIYVMNKQSLKSVNDWLEGRLSDKDDMYIFISSKQRPYSGKRIL